MLETRVLNDCCGGWHALRPGRSQSETLIPSSTSVKPLGLSIFTSNRKPTTPLRPDIRYCLNSVLLALGGGLESAGRQRIIPQTANTGYRRTSVVEDSSEVGDQWTFVAMDADSKMVLSWLVGKRNPANTYVFMKDVYNRTAWASRPQITTDGWGPYVRAVDDSFGTECDFAQLVKIYGLPQWPERTYSPSRFVEAVSKMITGNPDPAYISTSYIERQNLTLRMQLRRFTRLTNGFSKRLRHMKAAIALHFAHYNFGRIHSTLKVTPAMQAGITDHVWTTDELLGA